MTRVAHDISFILAICAALALACSAAAAGDEGRAAPRQPPKHHRSASATYPYRHLERYRSLGFEGDYPGDCAYMRAAGNCMIDLGYGRCEPCDMGMNK